LHRVRIVLGSAGFLLITPTAGRVATALLRQRSARKIAIRAPPKQPIDNSHGGNATAYPNAILLAWLAGESS
jgi:hypothetical protein